MLAVGVLQYDSQLPTGKVLSTHLLMVAVQAYLFMRFQQASGSIMAYLRTKTIYLQSLKH